MEQERDSDTSCNWCAWKNPQRIGKETGRLVNKRTSRDQPEYWGGSWKFVETCCHSNSSRKPSANTGVENSESNNNDNRCLQKTDILEWLTKEKTTLIQKDTKKGTTPNNDRPTQCLPMTWKILTAQIKEEVYDSLIKLRTVPRRTERMLQIDQRNWRVIIHWLTYPHGLQNETKKSS